MKFMSIKNNDKYPTIKLPGVFIMKYIGQSIGKNVHPNGHVCAKKKLMSNSIMTIKGSSTYIRKN